MPSVPIKLKRSGTPSATPTGLVHGEIALNYADAKLFWKDAANATQSFVFANYLPAAGGTIAGDLTVNGNITVNGTTTTINSTIVSVDDKAIELGAVYNPTDVTADGGGIILRGATDKTILWDMATTAWTFNQNVAVSGTVTSGGQLLVKTDDARLSDARTPTSHTHAASDITSGTLDAARIANDSITYAKLQNVSATDRLLGRSSAGSGDVEEISCTAAGRALLSGADAAAQRSTLSVQPTASPTFTGTLTAAQARVNGSDSSTILLVNGGTKGVRFNISSASSAIEGVDNGGVSSYQPLVVGGSTLTLATAGASAITIDGSQKTTLAAQLLVTAGSASACGVGFSGDPDTGIAQLGGANTLSFVTNEAERLQINADGNAIFTRPGEYALVMRRTDTGVTNNFISAIAYDAKNASGTNHSYCRLITQQTDATAGTESGQFYLQVRNNGTERSYVLIDGESDTVKLLTGGSERVRVSSTGNVTIGEANSANARLMVAGGSSNISGARATYEGTVQINENSLTSLESTGGIEFKASVFGSGYGVKLCGYDDGTFAIGNRANSATWSERLRINFSGETLIGTTTDNGAYLLQVNSQIYATNATIATSDARFKTRVESLTDATAVIEALRPVAFDFIPHEERNFATERQVGLIAQEAQSALADTDYADSVVAQCGDHLGLAYEKLVPVLIKALQESNARIAALEERLNHA